MTTDYLRLRDEDARRRRAIVTGRWQDAQERLRREVAVTRQEARYREQRRQEAGWRRTSDTRRNYHS